MDNQIFKDKLLELVTQDDEILKLNIVEELVGGYIEIESLKDDYKSKYSEIQQKYIETFEKGVEVEVEEKVELDEEVTTIDDIIKEEK